jgi:hypothetical protein
MRFRLTIVIDEDVVLVCGKMLFTEWNIVRENKEGWVAYGSVDLPD